MGTPSAWTPERRAKQREVIRRVQPWKKSTGPKTEEGKAASSRNALMPGGRMNIRKFRRELREDMALLEFLIEAQGVKPLSGEPYTAKKRRPKADELHFSRVLRALDRQRSGEGMGGRKRE